MFLPKKQGQRKLKLQPDENFSGKDDYWEDIFNSVDMQYLPLDYIRLIIVTFEDETVWEIDTNTQEYEEVETVEEILQEFFDEYEDTIEAVDFRLDLEKLKKDITKRTRKFLKHNK